MSEYVHYPVMREEVLSYLVPKREKPEMVDCTTGEGGHTKLFLEKYPTLHVTGLDRDAEIQKKAIERLKPFGDRFTPVNTWFNDYFSDYAGPKLDLVLFDLGISSFHFQESERGFSFLKDEKLDMRLDEDASLSASSVVNGYKEEQLADVIYKYGEERYSRRIARAIVLARKQAPIMTSTELAKIIFEAVPPQYRYGRIHPATRSFQAIRIEVNKELDRITPAIRGAVAALVPGGRLAVISFHSLEDRPVKWLFKELGEGENPTVTILTKKPLVPTEQELEENAPSRSAKLRVIEKR
jgi:16S rRNA (cytosine1402-N4)-methyltransferase